MPGRVPRLLSCAAAMVVLATASGCVADAEVDATVEDYVTTTPRLDRAHIVEGSSLTRESRATAEQDGSAVVGYRFEAVGRARVRIVVTPRDAAFAPLVALSGPVPGEEARIVAYKRGSRADGAVLETTLAAAGAYRLFVGTPDSFAGRAGEAGAFDVAFSCADGCVTDGASAD